MRNKGFTLIELLAVIVVLAIILAIAIPSVLNIISNTKIDTYKKNREMMVRATKNYTGTYINLLPANIGDTTEISLNDLQTNNYIEPIKKPGDSSQECNGYIIVTKINDSTFDYTPHLDCLNDAGSVAADGLLGHWKFDDFQEPTTNLASGFIENIVSRAGYIAEVTPNYAFPEYNTNAATRVRLTGGDINDPWPLQTVAMTILTNAQAAGKTFTTSAKVKNIGLKDVAIEDNMGGTVWVAPGETKFVTMTRTGNGNSYYQFCISVREVGDQLDFIIYQLQAEEKTYASLYTPNIRVGIVKDHSGNNNNSTLDLLTTPQWVSNSKVGTGAYNFDGIDDYIELLDKPSLRLSTGGTISVWIYPKSYGENNFGRIIDKSTDTNGTNGYILYANNGRITFTVNNVSSVISSNNSITLNNWQLVTVTFSANGKKIYINGVDATSSGGSTTSLPPNVAGSIRIGQRAGHTDRTFYGMIDDFKIYNRVLSAEEIKLQYDVAK